MDTVGSHLMGVDWGTRGDEREECEQWVGGGICVTTPYIPQTPVPLRVSQKRLG